MYVQLLLDPSTSLVVGSVRSSNAFAAEASDVFLVPQEHAQDYQLHYPLKRCRIVDGVPDYPEDPNHVWDKRRSQWRAKPPKPEEGFVFDEELWVWHDPSFVIDREHGVWHDPDAEWDDNAQEWVMPDPPADT